MIRRLPRLAGAALVALAAACGPGDATEDDEPFDASTYVPAAATAAPARNDLVAVPGTRVRLRPPVGFLPARDFAGFLDEGTKASILVTEFPAPYAEVVAGFTDRNALGEQGIQVEGLEARGNGAYPGTLVRTRQAAQGVVALKWIWIFGTDKATAMVMATGFDEADLAVLKAALLTTAWDPEATPAGAEGQRFELGFTGDFAVWRRMGGTVAYTLGGGALEGPGAPLFTIGPALGAGAIDDREAFARSRAEALPLDEVAVEGVTAIEVDGLPGVALNARGEDVQNGRTIAIYQAILFEPDNYWIAVGMCGDDLAAGHTPVFREMVASFRRTD